MGSFSRGFGGYGTNPSTPQVQVPPCQPKPPGGRLRCSKRVTVESCAVADITAIVRAIPRGSITTESCIDFTTDTGTQRVGVRPHPIHHPTGDRLRWYFACPGCERRAQKLYLATPDGRIACRICLDLIHSSARRGGTKWGKAMSPYIGDLRRMARAERGRRRSKPEETPA